MAALDVVRVRSPSQHNLLRARAQIQHGDLGIIRPARGRNCEEHSLATRQKFRPQMVGLAALVIGLGQHLRFSAGLRDPQQPSSRVTS